MHTPLRRQTWLLWGCGSGAGMLSICLIPAGTAAGAFPFAPSSPPAPSSPSPVRLSVCNCRRRRMVTRVVSTIGLVCKRLHWHMPDGLMMCIIKTQLQEGATLVYRSSTTYSWTKHASQGLQGLPTAHTDATAVRSREVTKEASQHTNQ